MDPCRGFRGGNLKSWLHVASGSVLSNIIFLSTKSALERIVRSSIDLIIIVIVAVILLANIIP